MCKAKKKKKTFYVSHAEAWVPLARLTKKKVRNSLKKRERERRKRTQTTC